MAQQAQRYILGVRDATEGSARIYLEVTEVPSLQLANPIVIEYKMSLSQSQDPSFIFAEFKGEFYERAGVQLSKIAPEREVLSSMSSLIGSLYAKKQGR